MRTAMMRGLTKGGGEAGLEPVCTDPGAAALIPISIRDEGATAGADSGGAEGAASSWPLASAQTKTTLGAIAPLAFLLLRTPPP